MVDIDDTVRRTYGYAKQGAGRGYTGVKGLNALLAVGVVGDFRSRSGAGQPVVLVLIFSWGFSACLWARRDEASGSGIDPEGRPRSGRRVTIQVVAS